MKKFEPREAKFLPQGYVAVKSTLVLGCEGRGGGAWAVSFRPFPGRKQILRQSLWTGPGPGRLGASLRPARDSRGLGSILFFAKDLCGRSLLHHHQRVKKKKIYFLGF